MTLDQKKCLRELLHLCIEHGFGSSYPLLDVAAKAGVKEPLYDNNTNTGVLWEFGPHGSGYINARGDWPRAVAGIDYDMAPLIENWTHRQSEPIG